MGPKEFEILCENYWSSEYPDIQSQFQLEIGLNEKKTHRFDLGIKDEVVMECKTYRYTVRNRRPSAKISCLIQEMFYMHLVPDNYRKILLLLKNCNAQGVSLGSLFISNYKHLIPDNVELFEYDLQNNIFVCLNN